MAMGFNKYHGGDNVRFGFYWNVKEWEAQIVPKEGGELKGSADLSYVRLPLAGGPDAGAADGRALRVLPAVHRHRDGADVSWRAGCAGCSGRLRRRWMRRRGAGRGRADHKKAA